MTRAPRVRRLVRSFPPSLARTPFFVPSCRRDALVFSQVAVGLPLPWLFFVFVYGCPVPVGGHAEGNGLSVFILLAMVAAVIVSIAASGWKMSKGLGYTMFGLYFVFIAQELARNYS